MNKNILKYIILSGAVFILLLIMYGPKPANARQIFGRNLREVNAPSPVHIKNGSFENPVTEENIKEILAANSTEQGEKLEGWELFNYSAAPGIKDRTVRLLKAEDTSAGQYTQIGGDIQGYLFQKFNTVPGTRLYYKFYSKAGQGGKSNLAVFVGNSYERENLNPVKIIETDSSWNLYTGVYEVGQGEHKTEIGFAPLKLSNLQDSINFIDEVSVKTGAYIVIKKESDKDNAGYVSEGDIINYTVYLKNFGQTAAKLNIEDSIDSNLEFLEVTEIESPVELDVYFDEGNSLLKINPKDGMLLQGLDDSDNGPIVKISYKARVKNEAALSGSTIQSQTSATYNDEGYLDYNLSDSKAYSDAHVLAIAYPKATSSVTVVKRWVNTNGNIPDNVEVLLYKDGVVFDGPAVLSERNSWTYTWTGLEAVHSDAEPRKASPSNSSTENLRNRDNRDNRDESTTAEYTSSSYYLTGRYTVREVNVPRNFRVSRKAVSGNLWIIENKYIKPEKDPLEDELDNKQEKETPPHIVVKPENNNNNNNNNNNADNNGSNNNNDNNKANNNGSNNNNNNNNKKDDNQSKGNSGSSHSKSHFPSTPIFLSNKKISLTQRALNDPEKTAFGEDIEYEIILKNEGNKEVKGVWVRDYMPQFTHFSEADSLGEYGCIKGKEHVSWFIKKLEPGESIRLGFKTTKDYCVAGSIINEIYYEILNTQDKPYINQEKNPEIKL